MNKSTVYGLICTGLFLILIFNILAPSEYVWLTSGKLWAVFGLLVFYGVVLANADEKGKS